MKRLLLITFLTLACIYSALSVTTVPVISTEGNETWYMIKCNPRDASNRMRTWVSVEPDDTIRYQAYTGADEQLWKVVANGTGVALVNKKNGSFMNVDGAVERHNTLAKSAKLTVTSAMPAIPLRLVPTTGYTITWDAAGWDAVNGGVFIVDNVNTVVDAANKITFNTSEGTRSFCLTSMSTNRELWSVYSWPGGNLNQAVLFRTPAEAMKDTKDLLLNAINTVKTALNNTSEGFNPGQFAPEDREALLGAIEVAQEVYDRPTLTLEEITNAIDELNAIFTIFKSQVILPELSNDVSEVWYYIQGTRPANTYMTAPAAGTGTQVKNLAVIPNETQLWKLVANGDGFALQNKGSQEYLQTDFPSGTNLATQSEMPTSALRFITSNETSNKAFRFWIENSTSSTPALRLHAGGSGNGWGLMNWTGNANDNSSWLFLSEDEVFRVELTNSITKAQSMYDLSVEGDEFGQYTPAKRTAFNTVITAEKAKNMATMNQDELKASIQALKDAMVAFECNRDVSTLSTLVKKKWFRLVSNSTASYATDKAISSNGRNLNDKYTFETKNVNSDAQLFTFELNEDATKAVKMVNKANGYYMSTEGAIVETAPETEFAITPLDNVSFSIRPSGKAPLHAQADGSHIVNWESGAGSSSAWRFEYVSSEDITDFKDAYLIKRMQMRAKVDQLKGFAGSEIGQYNSASVTALENLIVAEEAKNADNLTQDEMKNAILAMNSAAGTLVVNTDVKLLVSKNAGAHKWFRLINDMAGTGYASGKAMSSNGRAEGEAYTYEDKDENSDAQLFRFELTPDQTQVANIVNKGKGLYVTADGKLALASTADNNFAITQLGKTRSFWIDPTLADTDPLHAAAANSDIVNWLADAGSASAWIFEFAGETTGVKNVFPAENKIRTINNIITIDGVDNFEVYSATGQKLNRKARLATGVYIVRFKNYVQKVVLK